MGIFKKTSLGILVLSAFFLTSCATLYDGNAPERFSPEWWDSFKRPHYVPSLYIVFNDYQVGWIHNNKRHFTNSEFKEFVYGLEITKGCKKVVFWYGITLNRERVIRGAVIFN